MRNYLLTLFVTLLMAGHALAESWDSNKNIERAMDASLKTYRAKGMTGLVQEAQNCYVGLDTRYNNKHAGRDAEYCVTYELSAMAIDHEVFKATNFPRNTYLNDANLMIQMMVVLEKARVIGIPEDFPRYIFPRIDKIKRELPLKM